MRPVPEYDVIFTEQDIRARIEIMAQEVIAARLPKLVLVVLMKGGFMFASDMVRALARAGVVCDVDFITVSSYKGGTFTTQQVQIDDTLECDIQGRTVLILDDILDSGLTLTAVKAQLLARGAADVKSCVLLRKQTERVVDFDAEFIGFDCPNRFVFGYGMDYHHHFRQWPMIVALKDTQ